MDMTIYLVAINGAATLPETAPDTVLQVFLDNGYRSVPYPEYKNALRLIELADEREVKKSQGK